MKGYDACVFPREGEPMLICLEASAEDAARTAWTKDVRYVRGYDPTDPRPPPARTLDARARGRARRTAASGSSSRSARRPPTGWSASRRPSRAAWFDAWPGAADATPLLAAARALKTPQEIERMRLANEICAAAMEHVRAELRPGMKESEAAAIWQGFVHGEGTGWRGQVELALGFSLVWSGAGIKTFTATGDRPVSEDEPTLFEIWVCADGYWCDHTKNLCPGELRADYRELEAACSRSTTARSTTAARARASPSSTASSATGSPSSATPASRRTRSATASARARTSRRTPTRPAAARSTRAWCSRSSRAATGRAAAACASRTTS